MSTARFIFDTARRSADLYYATRLATPDPFIYFEINRKKYIVIKDTDIVQAKKSARVHKVLSLSHYSKKAEKRFKKPSQIDILDTIFKEFRVKKLEIPPDSPFDFIDQLRKRHYKIIVGDIPLYPERTLKTKEEKKFITDAQKTVFTAMGLAEKALRSTTIRKNLLYYKGKPFKCEDLRSIINVELLSRGYLVPEGTIVSCAKNSFNIHATDMGLLRPHEPIIIDIFPRSMSSLYCGDATRSFCVGKAPDKLKKMHAAVKASQEHAIKNIRHGVNGKDIHAGVHKVLESYGYKTGETAGLMQGFVHSTGHGVGIEIHDVPIRIGPVDEILKTGMVVSVEPGLYYKSIGGVRIEDLVYVTKNGCEILGRFHKRLEIL